MQHLQPLTDLAWATSQNWDNSIYPQNLAMTYHWWYQDIKQSIIKQHVLSPWLSACHVSVIVFHLALPTALRHFINSAYWTFTALDVARLEVRFCSVSARVDQAPYHDLGNLDAFNTDGSLAVWKFESQWANQIPWFFSCWDVLRCLHFCCRLVPFKSFSELNISIHNASCDVKG